MDETIATLKTEKEELVQELSGKKEKFDERIRKAWTDIKEEAVNINTNFKSLKSEHMNLVENFKTFSDEIEQVQRVGQNCRLLIKSKSAKQLLESLHQSIRQIHHTFIQRYQIMTSDIKPIMQSLENKTTFFSLEKVHTSAIDRRLAFQFDIDSHSDDIKFLLALSENILLVSNSKKCSLVIYSLGKSDAKCMNELNSTNNHVD
jgi:archaellum component FlaC